MERPSQVLHHGNPQIWFFSQKSSKFEFWLSTKSWNHHSFVNISPALVIDTSMERSSRVLHHGIPKIRFFFSKKFEFWFLMKSWNHLSFVDISPTLVIDASMEWSSQVLQHGNQKLDFFSRKFEIEFDLCWRAEINIQVGLTYMSKSGMHRHPFEGRYLVGFFFCYGSAFYSLLRSSSSPALAA